MVIHARRCIVDDRIVFAFPIFPGRQDPLLSLLQLIMLRFERDRSAAYGSTPLLRLHLLRVVLRVVACIDFCSVHFCGGQHLLTLIQRGIDKGGGETMEAAPVGIGDRLRADPVARRQLVLLVLVASVALGRVGGAQ